MSGRENSFRSASTYKFHVCFAVGIQGSVLTSNSTLNQAFSLVPLVCSENEIKVCTSSLFRQPNPTVCPRSFTCEKKPEKICFST